MFKKESLFYITGFVLALSAYVYFSYAQQRFASVTSFDECVSAGYPILETYPETCMLPGKRFTNPRQKKAEETQQVVSKEQLHDQIVGKEYLVNGQKISVAKNGDLAPTGSSSAVLLLGQFIEGDFTKDTKNDIVFLARSATTSSLYLMLAVGLYDGIAPANGVLIGPSSGTSTLQLNATGTLEVVTLIGGKELRKTFRVENDILKEN